MSEPRPRRDYYVPVWGVLVLFAGVLLLLQTLNILPWGLWRDIWRFWPVVIIVLGLNILLGRHSSWAVGVVVFILLGVLLGWAVWRYSIPTPVALTTEAYSEPLAGIESAQVNLVFAAGHVPVGQLHSSSSNLVQVTQERNSVTHRVSSDFSKQGSAGKLYLRIEPDAGRFWTNSSSRCGALFTPQIPLSLSARAAASSFDIDLSALKVTEFRLDADASSGRLKVPASGINQGYLRINAANIEISIPKDVSVKVKPKTSLSAFSVNEDRFPRNGDYYVSPDFDSAKNQLELEIDCNVSRVRIE